MSKPTKLPEIKLKGDRRQYETIVINKKVLKMRGDRVAW
jgi:hypothetical protein